MTAKEAEIAGLVARVVPNDKVHPYLCFDVLARLCTLFKPLHLYPYLFVFIYRQLV